MADRGVAVVRSRTNLAEDLKLCAIGPDGYSSSPRVVPGLGGALASELVLAERIGVESESVIVRDPTPTGDELVDELLAGLDDPDRGPVHLATWIAGVGVGASPHIHSSLVSKRLLGAGPAQRTRKRLGSVLTAELEPDARWAVLAGLAVACDLIEGLVAPTELERARARGLALATGEAVPESIRGSIRATQEATVSASLGAELSHTG